MKYPITISIILCLFLSSCHQSNQMTLIGNSSNDKLTKVEICNADREVLASTNVNGNKFKVVLSDIKYPELGFIKFTLNDKKHGTKIKKCIIEKATVRININTKNVSALQGGKLNQELINSWEESSAYKGAVKSLNDFKKSGRYIYFSKHTLLETKLQLKEMYNTLKQWIIDTKTEILEKKLEGNTAIAQLIILQQVGINNNNRKYLDNIENKLGTSKTLLKLRKKELRLLENIKKDKKLKIGNTIPNFELKNSTSKVINLDKIISKNRYTLVQFEDFTYYRSKDGYKQLNRAYKKYKDKGLEIVSVAITDNKTAWKKNIATYNLKWIQCSDLNGKKSTLMDKYRLKKTENLPINFLVNNKGKIIAKNISSYKFRDKFKTLFNSKK